MATIRARMTVEQPIMVSQIHLTGRKRGQFAGNAEKQHRVERLVDQQPQVDVAVGALRWGAERTKAISGNQAREACLEHANQFAHRGLNGVDVHRESTGPVCVVVRQKQDVT